MVRRLLIANRGEIALRILRACRECNIETVAAYTVADRHLLHLDYADQIFCISDTDYLDGDSLLMAAKLTGCDAVHPGYGFLSENAAFARRVVDEGLTWIGPDSESIALMGDKAQARREVSAYGLKPVPGSDGSVEDVDTAGRLGHEIGFPVVLKARYGGGGRGIRMVHHESELVDAFETTRNEAAAIFGQADVYLEKFLDGPRHVEIQVIGDGRGQAIHLGSRDCSIQRRHQKFLEEAPAPGIDAGVLGDLGRRCSDAMAALKYRNAGTLEFLYYDGEFYFIEMNTRIQVEHPVTEMITGLDLVRMQLEIAMTGQLPLRQDDVHVTGHAIECRINAEDVDHQPSPGTLTGYMVPGGPGIRVDSHLYQGYSVPHQYDSLVAKVVSHGRDREQATARMVGALDELSLKGIESNLALHRTILQSESFQRAEFDTSDLSQWVSP